MPWKRKTAKWTGAVVVVGALLVAGLFLWITRTDRGAAFVLEQVLERLQGTIEGEIVVEEIRADDLWEGATLYGIWVRGPKGELFLHADSAHLEYSPRTFFSGDVVFSRMDVWGPTVIIRKEPGEERFNVDRILKEGDDEPGPARLVAFGDVTLERARVLVYYPIPEGEAAPERAVVVPARDGDGRLRRIEFRDIFAFLPQTTVSSPDLEGTLVEVQDLSLVGRVFEDPFRVVDLEGEVRWHESVLTVAFSSLQLPGTRASGQVLANFRPEEGPRVTVNLNAPELDLRDLQWAEPRLPDGEGSARVELVAGPEGRRWNFSDLDVRLADSRVAGEGTVIQGGELTLREVDLTLSPLNLRWVEPFVEGGLPVSGSVRGQVSLDGTLDRLRANGRLTLDRPGESPSTARFAGTFHLERPFGFTGLEATLDPLQFALVREFAPGFRLGGSGRVQLTATGRLGGGIRFDADILHRPPDLPVSEVHARGTIREAGGDLVLDITSEVDPLSLTALRSYYPGLPFSGEVTGSIVAQGPLSDLRLTTDLDTEAGAFDVVARLNARDPGAFYQIEGQVAEFRLSALSPGLPDPTVLTGYAFLEGRGTSATAARATARLRVHDSRVGGLFVDTAYAALRVADGRLHIDTLDAVAGGVDFQGEGTLALTEQVPAGTVRITFATDSLQALRPLLGLEGAIARDTLSAVEREILQAQGVDPDTLPTTRELEVSGRGRGTLALTGSVRNFSAEGQVELERIVYGTSFLGDATIDLRATGLPGLEGQIDLEVEADSVKILDRAFDEGRATISFRGGQGTVDLALQRSDDEDYRVVAQVDLEEGRRTIRLEEMAIRFDTAGWEMVEPATIVWDDRGVTVQDLRILERGGEGVAIRADGTIPFEGSADFTLEVDDLALDRVARLAQLEPERYGGTVDLSARVTGTAADPSVAGTVSVADFHFDDVSFSLMEGTFDYGGDRMALDVDAWRDDLRILAAEGTVPLELSFSPFAARIPEEPIDLDVAVDSFPAALALARFDAFEDVDGTVAGSFHVGGTLQDMSPSGTLELQDAAATLPALGVRHEGIVGTLTLTPDGVVEVDSRASSEGGTAVIQGTVALQPATNPTFDLTIRLDRFQAVERQDVESEVSGLLTLTGTYDRPLVQGDLAVDRGVVYVQEFQRSARIVDLSDPAFFDVVDTTLVSSRPLLGASQNPFLRNLRMDVELIVEGDTWLRSDEMNVEIAGELLVTYDRREQDLVMVGELEAVRGSYTILGRRFVVQEGTVAFLGTPGINPDLEITAVNRLRRPEGDPLDILATVSGTLNNPRVQLSSDETGVAQSDLVSYLIFGRPSYELASSEEALVGGISGRLLGTSFGAGLSLGLGTLANRLGTLLGSELEGAVDYVAITQTHNVTLGGLGLGSTLGGTQVDLGWYLEDDLFLILVLRPLSEMSEGSGSLFAGVRLEWTPSDVYTLEAFWEDRFLRRRTSGFGDLGFRTSKILGLQLYREWGY